MVLHVLDIYYMNRDQFMLTRQTKRPGWIDMATYGSRAISKGYVTVDGKIYSFRSTKGGMKVTNSFLQTVNEEWICRTDIRPTNMAEHEQYIIR